MSHLWLFSCSERLKTSEMNLMSWHIAISWHKITWHMTQNLACHGSPTWMQVAWYIYVFKLHTFLLVSCLDPWSPYYNCITVFASILHQTLQPIKAIPWCLFATQGKCWLFLKLCTCLIKPLQLTKAVPSVAWICRKAMNVGFSR